VLDSGLTVSLSPYAAAARDLADRARFGALATVMRGPVEWPLATLVAVAFDGIGRPLLLLSRMAEHTKNLEACPRASVLVTDPGRPIDERAAPSPLACARMTVVGACTPSSEAERDESLTLFLRIHPDAAAYASFADFGMWRLEVEHVRWIGGFGRMESLSAATYAFPR
jgi:heme iron utilization protein